MVPERYRILCQASDVGHVQMLGKRSEHAIRAQLVDHDKQRIRL